MAGPDDDLLTQLTARIVAAYVKFNDVPPEEMTNVIRMVHDSLAGLASQQAPPEPRRPPAVPIRRSVTADSITCLDCGWSGKMIKRHISRSHNLTPEEYRTRWGLPHDYPMLSYAYSETRSALAKKSGLGVRGRHRRRLSRPDDPPPVEPDSGGRRRGRR